MYLVDDHRADAAEHAASSETGQHDVQRFGRRYQNVRGLSKHPRARGGRRVSRANSDPNLRKLLPFRGESFFELGERPIEISLNVVVKRFQRRDVKQMNSVRKRLLCSAHDQLVQLPQERRQSLSGSGRSQDER